MHQRWRSLKRIVRLWVDLFDEHNLLTYASAVAFQTFIALVALSLLALGILGATGSQELWRNHVGPAIHGRVLEGVYGGIDQIVLKVFHSSTAGLIAFGAALAVWEVSGVVRAAGGALNNIYEVDETRPWYVRFPISFALAMVLIASIIGAVALIWAIRVGGPWGYPLAVVRWIAGILLLVFAFSTILHWAPCETRATRWASFGSLLVVAGWIGQTFLVAWYVRGYANFRSAIGSLEVFIFAAGFLYAGAIVLLVGLELDELVRHDLARPRRDRELLPHVVGVLFGRTRPQRLQGS